MEQIEHGGSLNLGHNTQVGYFAQNEASLLDESITFFKPLMILPKVKFAPKSRIYWVHLCLVATIWTRK